MVSIVPAPPVIANKWIYNPVEQYLTWVDEEGYPGYNVKLAGKSMDSAAVLDWIMQLRPKIWVTPTVFYELVEALNYLFDGIQKNVCPHGFGGKKSLTYDIGVGLKERNVGWLVFPRPKYEGDEKGGRLSELVALMKKQDQAWFEESARLVERSKELGYRL